MSEGVVLPCLGLAKQVEFNNEQCLQPVVKDKLLCPIACIETYESTTSKLRTYRAELIPGSYSSIQLLTSSSIAC